MKIPFPFQRLAAVSALMLVAAASSAQQPAMPPDLTVSTNRYAIDRKYTYNLGPTGMRGWIRTNWGTYNSEKSTAETPWQILVTSVGTNTPASAAGILTNDVILGACAGGGAVSLFTQDARKSLGLAIGDAEAANGVLRLLVDRYGAGTNTYTLQLKFQNLAYSATAPYDCPKSARILADATAVISNMTFNCGGIGNPILGLAKLAVGITNAPVKEYASRACPVTGSLKPLVSYDSWEWAYKNIFLTEYFMMTGDTSVTNGILEWSSSLAEAQSMYGLLGHHFTENRHDGTRGSTWGYGPMHGCSIPAGISLVLAKKCGIVHPEIDPAIDRLGKTESYYVDKGSIPYGEHPPELGFARASGGKSGMAAMFFGLQGDKPAQTEYFTRMNMAEFNGMECWHCSGDGNYIWGWTGANMGGKYALAARLAEMRWYVDLARRCDGSFVNDAYDQGGTGGLTVNYWDTPRSHSSYGLQPTSLYVLLFSIPDKRIYLTGKNQNPKNMLSSSAIKNAIWAGHLEVNVNKYTAKELLGYFGEYDPQVRWAAAQTLAKSPGSTNLVPALIEMTTNSNPRVRQTACQALGTIKNPIAIPALVARLRDTNVWVRCKAGGALQAFDSAATKEPYLTDIVTAFIANGSLDQYAIDWVDPYQHASATLSDLLFKQRPGDTIALPTNLLYQAVKIGLAHPEGMAQLGLSDFMLKHLSWTNVQALAPEIVQAAKNPPLADRMFGWFPIVAIKTLAKYQVEEGIPLAVRIADKYVLYQGMGNMSGDALNILATSYRGSAKEALPALYTMSSWAPNNQKIKDTISAIQTNAGPALVYFKRINSISAKSPLLKWPWSTATRKLACSVTDQDMGIPRYHWSKISGNGSVTFSVNNSAAASNCTATFSAPGTYVLQLACDDGSIMDTSTWKWGYQPEGSQNYTNMMGAVYTNLTVNIAD